MAQIYFTPQLDWNSVAAEVYMCAISFVSDTSCELCGFDFENRKALASHARAHLRQLGIIEWKADGATSPIELLSELIRRDPAKVSEITKRYRMGDLYIKKVGCALRYSDKHQCITFILIYCNFLFQSHKTPTSPSPSTESECVAGGSLKSSMQHYEYKVNRKDYSNHSVRSSRGEVTGLKGCGR